MELILSVNWLAVVVGAVLAYVLGMVWYSNKLFLNTWIAGKGHPVRTWSMPLAMGAQAVATLLLSWTVGVAMVTGSVPFAILIGLLGSSLIESNGFFAGKSAYAIAVESGFVVAMTIIIIGTHFVL